ncbi:MAG TPA: DMT family protein [Hanamia sp.]
MTLSVFTTFMVAFFKDQHLRWNHLVGVGLLILAVFFLFKK